jgi:hypothetical protein
MNYRTRACLVTLLSILIAACSAHPKRVDCEGRLKAINAPASMKAPGVAQP